MSLVSIFLNCGPMLTVLLCAVLLKSEKVTIGLVVKALVAFFGVLLITIGKPTEDAPSSKNVSQESATEESTNWYDYLVLLLMPTFISFGSIAMGELRTLDPILIPFWSNSGIFIIGIIVCSLT